MVKRGHGIVGSYSPFAYEATRNVSTTAPTITEATSQIYEILKFLSSEDRQKVIQAAFALLGDKLPSSTTAGPPTPGATGPDTDDGGEPLLPPAATRWMRQNKLTMQMLEPYFHFDGEAVTVIGLPEGESKKEGTIAAYLLRGIASLLATGAPSFADEDARQLCRDQGCYDRANHAKICQGFGNKFNGSKEKGWQLTAPGLTAAAELIRPAGE
jgi:hypothetical protein